jgi:hypothetical protein
MSSTVHGWRSPLLTPSPVLDALDIGNLAAFLKMGGAMTIRSYVGAKVVTRCP